jgi:glycosyltransferase involved in cell wall biosynthesis
LAGSLIGAEAVRMRLCFVCSEYPPVPHGGLGTIAQVLGRALVRGGHEVRVVGIYDDGASEPSFSRDEGVEVWRVRESAHRFGWLRARYRLFRMVAEWSRTNLIDLVEVPDWWGPAAGWSRLSVPVVARLNGSATFFGSELGRPVRRTVFSLEEASLRRADAWCASSSYTAERSRQLFSLPSAPSAILFNPIELPSSTPAAPRSTHQIVFAGTLTAKKGVISLIRAWPLVVLRHPDAELHLYGKDGQAASGDSMRAHLAGLLDAASRSRVYFHGHVGRDVLYRAFATARAGIFPSYAEAFGIAPFEAMACGCPTIYTRRAPGPELLRDGMDGLLVDPDDPPAIAEAILRLLADDNLAARLGEAGHRRVVDRFAIDTLLAENEAFFAQAIERFRAGA